MRTIATFVITTAVLLLFSLLPVGAQEQRQCESSDVAITSIAATHPVDKMIVLNPEQAARVGAWFDTLPPESEFRFNFVVILKHTSHETGLLLGRDGKICMAKLVPDAAMPALLAAINDTGI